LFYMSGKKIKLIIALMSVALIGLIALQLYWVDNALHLQELQFNQNVNLAMNEVVDKLEKEEAAGFIASRLRKLSPGEVFIPGKDKNGMRVYSRKIHMEGKIEVDSAVKGKQKTYRKFIFSNVPEKGYRHSEQIIIDGKEIRDSVSLSEIPDKEVLRTFFDSVAIGSSSELLRGIFRDLNFSIDLGSDVNPRRLDSLIRVSLANHNAGAEFQWGVYNARLGNFMLPGEGADVSKLSQSPYKVHLYPGSIFPKPDYLTLYFPGKSNFLYKRMGFVMSSSVLLILLIIYCFSYTVLTLLRQKKLSEMKTDFINNMTHEFKTPVSTILLASEALKEPDVVQDRERFNRLVGAIHEENNRIARHVERVLQLAAMEKGNFRLNPAEVDLHELITGVTESMSIQAEHKGGTIRTELAAARSTVMADPLHFSNVIRNLLDNAIKYCIDPPDIRIATADAGDRVVITVEDNGIGLTREQQARIFEQFYRVPTGNLHDVKGFGLGLHYVKTIVEMHEGTIRVKSEKGRGSIFEITLKHTGA
jgi:two-component system, OmpR family, phosphate regulon sensor histidine kinase PhoR